MRSVSQVTEYACSSCGYASRHEHNVKKHTQLEKCRGSEVIGTVYYPLAWTADPELARAVSTGDHAAIVPGLNRGGESVREVVPAVLAFSAEEEAAIKSHVVARLDGKFATRPARDRYERHGIIRRLVVATKGPRAPPHLRNMSVSGNYVAYTTADGEGQVPKGDMAKRLFVWYLEIYSELIQDLLAGVENAGVEQALTRLWDDLYAGDVSILRAATLYRDSPEAFQRCPEKLRMFVKGEVAGIRGTFDRELPRFTVRAK